MTISNALENNSELFTNILLPTTNEDVRIDTCKVGDIVRSFHSCWGSSALEGKVVEVEILNEGQMKVTVETTVAFERSDEDLEAMGHQAPARPCYDSLIAMKRHQGTDTYTFTRIVDHDENYRLSSVPANFINLSARC
jgi:hypothetical protein